MSNLIPDGWNYSTFGCVTKIIKSGLSRRISSQDIGVPVLTSGNIQDNRLDTSELKYWYLDDPQGADINRYTLNNNDLLLCFINSLSQIGKVCVYKDIGRPAIYTTNLFRVVINAEHDSTFIYNLITDKVFQEEIQLITKPAVNQASFTKSDLELIRVLLPPLPEQQKIAAILTSVDDVIEKTQAQIDKIKDLKTGMMQELLTRGVGVDGKPHTEFKDSPVGRIPKGWGLVKLSEVLTKIDSGWSPACIEVPPQTGEWGVLKVSSVTRGEFLETQSKTLPSNLEPKVHIKVKNGDLLLTRANGVADLVGKCVMIQSEPRSKLMMSDKILRLNPNDRIYSNFLLHVFNSQEMRRQIELSWGGSSGQKNISQADIKNYFLALPSFDEQKIIGDSISQIDRVLSAKKNKLVKMNNTKKALMQDLLTGKVRVKSEE